MVVVVSAWRPFSSAFAARGSRRLSSSLGRQSGGYLGSNFRAFIATFSVSVCRSFWARYLCSLMRLLLLLVVLLL